MLSLATLITAAAAIGVQFGSQPLKDGGHLYILQVEPELVDSLSTDGFSSDVPPGLRDIRRLEIRVGNERLPNQGVTALKGPVEVAKPNEPTLADPEHKAETDQFAIGAELLPGGGNKLIVQIERGLVRSFRDDGFACDVPAGLKDIRRIEVRVGAAPLPNQGLATFKAPKAVEVAKPLIVDAAEPDPGAKRPADADRQFDPTPPPRKQPSEFAGKAAPTKDPSVQQTVFQSRERPAALIDGGPSAVGNSPGLVQSAGGQRPASGREGSEDWASIPLLAALGALILSAAANFYLLWVHLGTRRRYFEVVQQLHESELPIALPPLDHVASDRETSEIEV